MKRMLTESPWGRDTSHYRNLFALVGLVLCVVSAPIHAQESLADVIERTERSVVRLDVVSNEGQSIGSGFVVDGRGTIVTNCHVLAGATKAVAHFANGNVANVEGTYLIDPARDIVVAKISSTSAPAIELLNANPRKGERVTALGSPRGLSFTATSGIISAVRSATDMAREMGRENLKGTWVQVDAALSPGNSGGPLINSEGKVVAMSTLASMGDLAQNLNFGISSVDIFSAIVVANSSELKPLREGAAKVQMAEESSSGGGINAGSVPDEALEDYIAAAVKDYAELMRGLRAEAARLGVDLKEMRKGSEAMPSSLRSRGASVARVDVPGKRERQWFFQSRSIKEAAIERQQERVREYTKLKNQIRDVKDPDSLFTLLWNFGPPLQPRKTKSVGFVSEFFVVHAFNAHDVLAVYEEDPCLVWLDSTAGISEGDILTGPVFVAGTTTISTGQGPTRSVTVYQEVTEEILRSAIKKHLDASGGGIRTWSDKTGRFSIKAKLLGADSTKVALQKEDGSIINVPIASLSEADQAFLRDRN